ncbi:MAG TPA: tetratricopeptide repeat protein [Verrucomicrobiae bacterium]|nr:tetratricopeptide repeat protein [Verrucomicrobiae bacterium]
MIGRWILCLLLTASFASGIQRPDTKTTLRSLARLPRVEPKFSLDFSADGGFSVFETSKDPRVAAIELRQRISSGADSKSYLELASLRNAAGDLNATRDFQRAVEALRKQIDSEGGNARLKIDLATALHGLGRATEAESIFRETIKLAPTSTNHVSYSAFLEARAWEIAADTSNWRGRRPYADLCRRMLDREPSSESMGRVARLLDESLAAAREAVRRNDDYAPAQHRLAIALASKDCFEAMRRRLGGQDYIASAVETAIFSEAALPALEMAADLDPANPIRRATVILWRALATAGQKRVSVTDGSLWQNLPEETRRHVSNGLEALRGAGGAATGPAAEALGTLRFILQNDLHGAADDLRRAIGFIPDSEQLWETLSLVLSKTDEPFELAAVCEARVYVRPNVRNRVLLASAHEKLGNRPRALEELNQALALNSNDFTANVALAALLMRDATSDDDLSPRVRQSLINAERAVRSTGNGHQLVELALAQSIYHGLIDEPERARDILKAALAYDKNDDAIAAALNAIGY